MMLHRILMVLTALILLCEGVSPAKVMASEAIPIHNWSEPGVAKFTGSDQVVCDLLKDHLTLTQCAQALDLYNQGAEGLVIYLEDDQIMRMTASPGSVHEVKTRRVALGSRYGPRHPDRRAVAYPVGSPGEWLVRPDACGNWSYMSFSELSATETVADDQPQQVRVCTLQPRQRQMVNEGVFTPGLLTCGGACAGSTFVLGLFIPDEITYSRGYSQVCTWQRIQ